LKRFKNNYEIDQSTVKYCTDEISKVTEGNVVFTNSATSGMLAVFRALDLNKDDEVILPSYAHPACDNICNVLGYKKVYAKNKNLLVDVDDIISKISSRTKIIVYCEVNGYIDDNIFRLKDICKERNIFLMEDSAASFKQKINGTSACSIGDASSVSFSGTKLCYLGGGGLVSIKDQNLAKEVQRLVHIDDYTNFNPKTITSYLPGALFEVLKKELELSDERVQKRIEIFDKYLDKLDVLCTSDYHNYNVCSMLSDNLSKIKKKLDLFKIEYRANVYPDFLNTGTREKHIDLPFYTDMTDNDINLVTSALKDV